MATLEKIRSKSVLLLIIVGAALLAFIIGDFFTSGRTLFGTGTTIAKVGDSKVDVQEFQRRVQQVSQQNQQNGQRTDNAALQQQVLDAMIYEKLFNDEIKALGIVVTDNELTDVMVGKNSAYVDRMVQQQLGVPDAATVHDMAFNPTKYGVPQEQALQLQQYWIEMEQNIEQMLLQQKFQNLFSGLLTANELDAKAIYDDNANTANVIFARKDFSSLPDADFPVDNSDLKRLYDSEKNNYAIDQERRLVNYITVNIVPSASDMLAGQQKVEDALMALNEQPETQGISDMPEFISERRSLSQADVDKLARLKAALDSLSVGRATLVSKVGNDYDIVKLIGKSQQSDKVKLDFLAVQGSRAQVDSLISLLNAGASFDSIAASPLVAQSQKETEYSLLESNAQFIKEIIDGRATGVYFTPDTTDNGGRIVRVAERSVPTTVYDIASVSFTTEPSNATVNELESKLQNYVSTHRTAAEFVDSAQAAGYTTFPFYVTPSSASISNITDSHSAVAWAMDAKKGEVSPVMGDIQSGRLIALTLEDIYDDFIPVRDPQVKDNLTRRAINEKKAARLIADYAGKADNVPAYAALMSADVDTTSVNFGQQYIPGIGVNESELQGKVAVAKAGDLIGPAIGNTAVVVMQVIDIDSEGRPFDVAENTVRFNQTRGAARLANNLPMILIGKKKVDNRMTTFYK